MKDRITRLDEKIVQMENMRNELIQTMQDECEHKHVVRAPVFRQPPFVACALTAGLPKRAGAVGTGSSR